jgi:hypothetical protein
VPEGFTASEVGKEIAEHRKHAAHRAVGDEQEGHRDRWISVVEAVLLSLVAVVAAYSGFAAAKWSTESRLTLAKASTLRSKGNRADLEAVVTRTQDSARFNAWFTAFVAGNATAEQLAERRLRPGYRVAFDAWLATDPAHNPNAPAGPSYMPQYVLPQAAAAASYDRQADAAFTVGSDAGDTSDKYIQDTVFLAVILFLIGIGSHFTFPHARYGLVGLSTVLLVFSVVQLIGLPAPP